MWTEGQILLHGEHNGIYIVFLRFVEEDTVKQVKALTLCVSRWTLPVIHNLRLSKAQMKKLSAIIVAMQKYMDGHINEIMEHHKFCHWIQQQEETFDDYLISLRELAKTCIFCSDACMQKVSETKSLRACMMGILWRTFYRSQTKHMPPQLPNVGAKMRPRRTSHRW